jgi:hypothetical protein
MIDSPNPLMMARADLQPPARDTARQGISSSCSRALMARRGGYARSRIPSCTPALAAGLLP